MTIRILIADDHDVVAAGLRFVVETQPDMAVIACVQESREAVRLAIEHQPDVVLIDHAMPALNGTEAAQMILSRCPQIRVVVVSMYSNQIHVVRALQAGAAGYVVKNSAAREIVDAVRAVYGGARYLSAALGDIAFDPAARKVAVKDPLHRLSSRERQVLQMLAEGQSVVDIASALALSPKTVETYRTRMMEKLEIHDLATLVKFALQQGVTPLE
jgi:two-component system, NarL family, response regulator NreC